VSPLVKRLQALGLVEKRRRTDDERAVSLSLTEAGRALREKALPVPRAMASCLFAAEGEYESLKATIGRLLERLGESRGGT
jgi:DNA-binding MarR family transcriptional regulator